MTNVEVIWRMNVLIMPLFIHLTAVWRRKKISRFESILRVSTWKEQKPQSTLEQLTLKSSKFWLFRTNQVWDQLEKLKWAQNWKISFHYGWKNVPVYLEDCQQNNFLRVFIEIAIIQNIQKTIHLMQKCGVRNILFRSVMSVSCSL